MEDKNNIFKLNILFKLNKKNCVHEKIKKVKPINRITLSFEYFKVQNKKINGIVYMLVIPVINPVEPPIIN